MGELREAERLGSCSGIWVLEPTPRRIFVFWDLEPIWLEQISRHYASPWQELGYYLLVADAAHSMRALSLGAEDRKAYVDLDRPLGQGWVEWGIWANDRPHLVILRTKAPGHQAGPDRRWTRFDGYGEARPFASSLVGRDGGKK